MRFTRLPGVLAAAAVLVLPAVSQAQVTTFTSLSSWLAATQNQGLDTFNNLTLASTPSPLNRTAGSFTYTASTVPVTGTDPFFPAGTIGDIWLATNIATTGIRFSNFSPTTRAMGGLFFGSDVAGAFRANTNIQISGTLAGGGTFSQLLTNTTTGTFFGIVTTANILTFDVFAVQPQTGFAWATVNDFRIANPASNVIPEPSTYALMATGLIGLAGVARRRRKA